MALSKHKKNGLTARLLKYYLTPNQKVNAVNAFVQKFSLKLKTKSNLSSF